jgi:potassium channel subfamily K
MSLAEVRSALTIGYGDLVPVNTWGKILVFPFFVLTISQLANEVLIIFGFIKDRAEQRRNEWRKRYEAAMHAEANTVRPMASLVQEMALIQDINKREEMFVRPSTASLISARQ